MDCMGITQLVTMLSNLIFRYTTAEEAALLGAMFTQLGDTLVTLSAVCSIEQNKNSG